MVRKEWIPVKERQHLLLALPEVIVTGVGHEEIREIFELITEVGVTLIQGGVLMKNSIITIMVTAMLTFCLIACGSNSSAGPAAETSGSSKESPAAVSEISSSQESVSTETVSESKTDAGPASAVIDEEITGLLEDVNPADKPASCDGFEDLSWGSTLEDLPKAESTEVVRRGVEFAGYYGSAYYNFDAEDRLVMGVYRLNENATLEWPEALKIFLSVRKHLISEYGTPSEVQRSSNGPSSLEEYIAEGSGAWSEMWAELSSSEGDWITLTETLQGSGMIEIQFLNMAARQGQ